MSKYSWFIDFLLRKRTLFASDRQLKLAGIKEDTLRIIQTMLEEHVVEYKSKK